VGNYLFILVGVCCEIWKEVG